MYVDNIFFLKDWASDKLFLLILSIQTLFFLLVFLDQIQIGFPLLKELVGLFFLLFIPGTLLLRIINIGQIDNAGEVFLYTIGGSVVILMTLGFFINYLYPFYGIGKPLSFLQIIISLNLLIFFSCFICYFLDLRRENSNFMPKKVDLKKLIQSSSLFPFLIPILSILGAYSMNVYHSNALTILLIIFISFLVVLIGIKKVIKPELYPLIVFCISISLLFHKSLITNYIWGWDITYEYYLANQVVSNSFWDMTIPASYNSMLSVIILAPIIYSYTNIPMVWIMKIIYPFLFSLVPLGLFYVISKQTTSRIAFLSVFAFMLMFTFHTEMLALTRQQIAELMLVLVLMLIVNNQLVGRKRYLLAAIFGMAIIVAHYGLTYVLMIILLLSTLFLYFYDNKSATRLIKKIRPGNYELSLEEKIEQYKPSKNRIITPYFLSLFILFLFSWYIYTASSSIFESSVLIAGDIIKYLYSFMDPNTTQGLSMVLEQQITLLRTLHKYLYIITQIFISLGILVLFLNNDHMQMKKEYKAISLATFIVMIAGLVLPFFSNQMNTTRLYHVAFIILAPFFVLGFKFIFDSLNRAKRWQIGSKFLYGSITVFLIIFLCFDTGLVYEFFDAQHPTSIALSNSLDFPKFNDREIEAGQWVSSSGYGPENNYSIYADKYRTPVLGSMVECSVIPMYFDLVSNRSCIFLGTLNSAQNEILTYEMVGSNIVIKEGYVSTKEILKRRSKIFDNGGATIYGEVNTEWI